MFDHTHTGAEQWIPVGTVEEVPPGTCKRIEHLGTAISVFNVEGSLFAIGDKCTHAEASLCEGEFYEDLKGWVVECPLHGSQFDLATGQAVSLPATGNAGKYAVKVEDGVIYVNVVPVIPRHE
jgi:3-phenylpropionate/trans-cinnamate dioxygenase ferredoxin subunit